MRVKTRTSLTHTTKKKNNHNDNRMQCLRHAYVCVRVRRVFLLLNERRCTNIGYCNVMKKRTPRFAP